MTAQYAAKVQADIAHEQAVNDATLKYNNGEIISDVEQQQLRSADYAWSTKKDLADFNWRDRAAIAEQTFARDEAARQAADLTPQTSGVPSESGVEETYSEQVAVAQRTEDLALAGAERQDILDQTTADNAQRQSDASANAAFLSAQYAAKVTAMQTLAGDLNNAPWAQYQVARAAAEEAAWDGTGPSPVAAGSSPLAQDYLIWQQQVSDAYTTYANARAAAYFSSATDIANRTNTDAQYSAGRTAQEVAALAGDEFAFETHLAGLVYHYREDMALADQVYYDALAAAARDGTPTSDAYDAWTAVSDESSGSAAQDYQSGYVQRDGQRRHYIAQARLSFVRDLPTVRGVEAARHLRRLLI